MLKPCLERFENLTNLKYFFVERFIPFLYVQEQLQLELVAMESFHTYSRELLDKGRPSDITRAASELHKRATELLDNDVSSVQYCPPHVTFTPADVTQLTPSKLIGKLTFLNNGNAAPGFHAPSLRFLLTILAVFELSKITGIRADPGLGVGGRGEVARGNGLGEVFPS